MADELDVLLEKVTDPGLRRELRTAVDKVRAKRNFGLVFESHLPERVRLPEYGPVTSSSGPPSAPASELLRFTDAARLHARRFNKHPVASALRLLSADQRITHPDGGIALLTEVGHGVRATALFAATYIPAFLGMLYGFATGSIPLIALTLPAVLVSALVLGSRCERQVRAFRTFETVGNPWVLSDVATEPHLGIGHHLMAQVVSRADCAKADVVLTVEEDNGIARALYSAHHFIVVESRGLTISMRRRVRAGLIESQLPHAGDDRWTNGQ